MTQSALLAVALLASWSAVTRADTKTWNGGAAAWSDPAAWTPPGMPGASDDIVIAAGSVYLNVPVVVSQRFTWSGGTLHSGAVRVASGGTLELTGPGDKVLYVAALMNGGTARVNGPGRLGCLFTGYSQSVLITNETGGVFELAGDAQVAQLNPSGWPGGLVFANDGLVLKTGEGPAAFASVPLYNRGTLDVSAGSLRIEGGGRSSGLFKVAATAAVDLQTGLFDLAGARWEGAGPVRIRNTTQLQGAFHADNFGHTGGTLSGDFEIAGAFEWSGGSLVGGQARLGPGAHRITGASPKEMLVSTFANAGHLRIEGAAVGLRFTGYGQAAFVTNAVGGTLEFIDGAVLEQRNPGSWPPSGLALVNEGTLRANGAGTNGVLAIPLHNRGSIEVQSGVFQQSGGGQSSGQWSVAAGAAAEWLGGGYQLQDAAMQGPGPVVLKGNFTLSGSVTADQLEYQSGVLGGTCEIRSGFRWTGGRLAGAALRLGAGEHRIAGLGNQILFVSSLANAGHLVIEDTTVEFEFTGYNQANVITNESSGVIEVQGTTRLGQRNAGGWGPGALQIVNQGTLRFAGGGTNQIERIPLHNAGLIEVRDALVQQTAGGVSSGQFTIAAEGRVELGGGTYNLGGSRWTGVGPARITTTSTLLGTFEAANLGLTGGDLGGEFDVAGGFEWTGGRLAGARARLGPGTHRIGGSSDKVIFASTLANAGRLVLDDCTLAALFTGYNQSAIVTNEPNGVLEFAGAARFEQRNGGGWSPAGLAVVNEGTLRTTGEGVKNLTGIPLHNRGRVELEAAVFQHTGGGISPGEVRVASSARYEFSVGTYQLGGSHWRGPGPSVVVSTATIQGNFVAENMVLAGGDLSGECGIEGGFTWTGGRLAGATVRLGPGEHRIVGANDKVLFNSILANAGHLVCEDATVGVLFTGYNQVGQLVNEAAGRLDLAGAFRMEQRNGSGWPPAALNLENRGWLRQVVNGSTMLAAVPLFNQGRLELEAGLLQVDHNVTFADTSELVVTLGAEPRLRVAGTASLGGTLEARTVPGQSITEGATFEAIRAGAITGAFTTSIAQNPGHQFAYAIDATAKQVRLTAQDQLTEPVRFVSCADAGSEFAFEVSGKAGLIYLIESSPNLRDWQLDRTVTAPADVAGFKVTKRAGDSLRAYRIGLLP